MRQQWIRIVPAVAVLLLGAAAVRAQPEPSPQGPQRQGFERRGPQGALMQRLELSEDQQGRVREILDEQRPQLHSLHERIATNRDALHQLLEGGSSDANAVGELVLEGRTLQEESRAIREAGQKAIRGILTPEQQQKFDKMEKRRHDRGKHGQGQRRKRGGAGAPGMPGMPGAPRAGSGEPPPSRK